MLVSILFIIISIVCIQSCSFEIEAITQTPKVYDILNASSPDCDDAAVLINKKYMNNSLVVGTLKEGGLQLYDLNGNVLQSIAAPSPPNDDDDNKPGKFNNVGALFNTNNESIVIVSDRGLDQLRFYKLNSTGLLDDVTNTTIPWVFSTSREMVNDQETAYGLTATNFDNKMTVLVSQRHQAVVAKINIIETDNNLYSYQVIETLILPNEFEIFDNYTWIPCNKYDGDTPQIEGLIVDPSDGTILISQEDIGLWKTTFNDFVTSDPELLDTVTTFGVEYERIYDETDEEYTCIYNGTNNGLSGNIVADAEGISLYVDNDDHQHYGYYVLSSQGANTFMIYSRKTYEYIANFSVSIDDDMVQNTDGVEIQNGDFGDNYPEGIIIVQDEGDNFDTNFKFASFTDVLDGIEECLNATSSPITTMTPSKSDSGLSTKDIIIYSGIGVAVIAIVAIVICVVCRKQRKKKKHELLFGKSDNEQLLQVDDYQKL